MNLDNLSPELLEKAKECKTLDEFAALAKEAGLELTDEMLAEIAGGRPEIAGLDGFAFALSGKCRIDSSPCGMVVA